MNTHYPLPVDTSRDNGQEEPWSPGPKVAGETNGTSLAQTEIWVDRQGVVHRVEEMSVRYKANVVAFLERRATAIEFAYSLAESRFIGSMAEHAQELAGEALSDEWERRMDDPVAWLRSTPLVKRLIADIEANRGGDDG